MKFSIDFEKLTDTQMMNIIDIFADQHPKEFEDLTKKAHHFELTCEEVERKKFKVLVGDFTFLDPQIDGEHKCIINEVQGVLTCTNEDIANETGEKLLEMYESYLVLPSYGGEIEYDEKFNKLFEEIFGEVK
jgi:hypothetical protein